MSLLVLGDPYMLPVTSNLTTWGEDPCPLQPLLIEKPLLFSDLHSQPPLSGKHVQVLIFTISIKFDQHLQYLLQAVLLKF